ncbi:hypothetical protein HHI36_019641 [Cryptolaemus montrouzieri]|uniref:Uncharacterized protein n=1 Tax=Cryptolaemus montrouzieri TaxID=559131 RepID=A0ABD2N8K2_9CUCU
MRRLSWFHPAAKFLIVGTNFSSAMLKYIAKYHVINVTILDSSSGNISTTYPYKTRSLQRINTDPSLIGYCNDSLLSMTEDHLFPRKIPTYWKKTYLRLVYEYVEIFSNCVLCEDRYKGIESEIFIIIFEHLEMRLKAVKYTFSEGSAGYLEVLNCETDMIFGLYARVSGYKDAEVTSPYLQEHMLWFIPVAPEIPRWKQSGHHIASNCPNPLDGNIPHQNEEGPSNSNNHEQITTDNELAENSGLDQTTSLTTLREEIFPRYQQPATLTAK